ncbi:hypothetical protein GCM10007276_01260 [Agaricicola taiwanensis]|uniref:YbgF trimerisation domain-containing protein n=1 Tax=Agaricicola taiwanensis TaxID=591372 RepID=A0A8J2VJT4_9RHOB|nr:hypothetical protein [Agaricicola taiwanensis]GGE27823.1 hypothetical protein GCM10007276_01260 [Agaricicola taiwanensis]
MSDTSGKGPDKPTPAGAKAEEPKPSAARPRPPVIDLEAKDVGKSATSTAPAASGAPSGSSPSSAAPPPKDPPRTSQPQQPGAAAKSAPPPPPQPPKQEVRGEPANRAQPFLPLMAAGIGGAVVAALLMLGLSAVGLMPNADADRVAALEGDVVRLQDALSTAQGAENADPRVAELERKLAEFGERLEAAAVASETAPRPDDTAVTDLAGRLQQIEQDSTALSARLDGLAEADRALEQQINTVSQSSQANTAQQTAETSTSERSALALSAAAALDTALVRGQPYGQELSAVQAFMPQADVEALAPHAETGLPPAPRIAAQWRQALDSAPPPPPPANAGVVDRLMANASSLIRVTPMGEPEGDAPEARRARFLGALDRADLAAALAEWNAFDPSLKKATEGPAAMARARIEAEKAGSALRTLALDEARKAVTDR